MRGLFSTGFARHWRRETLRTNLWLVPAIEVAVAVVLFAGTLAADRAASAGDFALPGWVISGSADAAEPTYDRLVQRSFEKIRQASNGMPAVMIRQLEALTRIMAKTSGDSKRRVLLEQAAMIDRAGERTVPEAADRADIRRAYEAVLTMESRLVADEQRT